MKFVECVPALRAGKKIKLSMWKTNNASLKAFFFVIGQAFPRPTFYNDRIKIIIYSVFFIHIYTTLTINKITLPPGNNYHFSVMPAVYNPATVHS